MLCSDLTSICDAFLMSYIWRSASYPSAILPLRRENSLPALSAPMDTASCIGMSPLRTSSIAMGMVVSTPGIPDGAASNSWSFSSAVCGAWSDPNMSMAPSRNLEYSFLRFSGPRTGGLTLYLASVWRSTSK